MKTNEQILSELEALIEQEVKNLASYVGKMETAVMELTMLLGKGLLQHLVDCKPNGYYEVIRQRL